MAESKLDEAIGSITEKELKSLHKVIKPRKEHNPLKFFKFLTIAVVILILLFIFLFWRFNVVDLPTYKQYEGKSRVYFLTYCDIAKFRCETSKLQNDSIIINIENKFNEIIGIKEISFGNCTNKYDVVLSLNGKTQVTVSCENYRDMNLIYGRESGISHKSEGKVSYILDLSKLFKIFLNIKQR